MNLPTINSLKDHELACARLESLMLMEPKEDTKDEKELVALALAIEHFEKQVFTISVTEP